MLDGETHIVAKAVEGESSAFGLLYDHYQPHIYRFVAVKVGHREEAEDLTHQVFLHAWLNIRSYRDKGFPFSSWLYRIARNQVIDHYRTRKSSVPIEDIPPDLEEERSDLADRLDFDSEMSKVWNALARLKPDYQDVIILRFIEEFSVKETAEMLKKSEGAIKLMQHRAIKQLKSHLPPQTL